MNIIHPSVDSKCSMGHFNVIGENVVIGESKLGNYCEIRENVKIGDNCILQGKIKIAKDTVLEDDVILKYGVILTDKVHVKKNCFIGPNVITLGGTHKRETLFGTVLGENCYIGGGSQIAAGVQICADVIIGAMTFVNKDIDTPGTYVGVPHKRIK